MVNWQHDSFAALLWPETACCLRKHGGEFTEGPIISVPSWFWPNAKILLILCQQMQLLPSCLWCYLPMASEHNVDGCLQALQVIHRALLEISGCCLTGQCTLHPPPFPRPLAKSLHLSHLPPPPPLHPSPSKVMLHDRFTNLSSM